MTDSSWIALALVSFCCGACGRIGVQAVTAGPSDPDASAQASEEDAGMDGRDAELDAEPEPEPEPGDASQADGASRSDAGSQTDAAPTTDSGPGDAGLPNLMDGAAQADASAGADSSLALRYDFAGTGSVVMDRVGTSHGQVLGGALLDGSGGLTLDGVDDFVDLPNGLLSRFSSVTVMAWLTYRGGPCWQRIFDFGSSDGGEGNAGSATSAFSLSPGSCPNRIATGLFELNSDLRAVNGVAISLDVATQVALALDGARGTLTLFMNGALVGETAVPWQLSQLQDVNNWLGRSQWVQDRFLQARLDELRIYGRALSASEVRTLNTRGPDAP
jgi:hypothetical protein